jgi:hypothetical protein
MPRQMKAPRLHLKQWNSDKRRPQWIILHGRRQIWTGRGRDEMHKAEEALNAYCSTVNLSPEETKASAAPGRYGMVYFLSCDSPGFPIKIGFTADVVSRISSLQTAMPFKMILLTCITGTRQIEHDLHHFSNLDMP